MRLIPLFLALCGTGFALHELHALKATAPPPIARAADPPADPPREHTPPPLSTWRGPLPFGGVPSPSQEVTPPAPVDEDVIVNGDVDDEVGEDCDDCGEGIPDVEDRCPYVDGTGDNDGCPDPTNAPGDLIFY